MHMCEQAKAICRAIEDKNWKWVYFELVKDEVTDMEKYLYLHDLAMEDGKEDCAMFFMNLAHGENDDALALNEKYLAHGYTAGTERQIEEWDMEYTNLMKTHANLVKRLGVRTVVDNDHMPVSWEDYVSKFSEHWYNSSPMDRQAMRLTIHKLID